MGNEEILDLSIHELKEAYLNKRVSPVEVTESALTRIRRLNGDLKAFITVTDDIAMKQAKKAEEEMARGIDRGMLHGVPIALKDLYDTAGILTTGGSPIFQDNFPDTDATTVSKLHESGTVLLGKTNLHEFATGSTSDNATYGTCRNAWDRERIPGGSSGGSGVAVATGMAFMAMGSDTGGSIRSPAALNGVVGFKPTYGLVSRAGVMGLSWSMDHAGPLTKTVKDAAHSIQVLAGYDPKDPTSVDMKLPDFASELEKGLKGLRVGIPREYFFQECTEEVAGMVYEAISVLEKLGAEVREVSIPHAELAPPSHFAVILSEAAVVHKRLLRDRIDEYDRDVGGRLLAGSLISAEMYHKAQRVRSLIDREVKAAMKEVDLLVTANNPITAPRIGQELVNIRGRDVWVMSLMSRLIHIHNCTGVPAITVPCGFASDGMPVGLHLAGRLYEDSTVLRAAHGYEQATSWHTKRPPVITAK